MFEHRKTKHTLSSQKQSDLLLTNAKVFGGIEWNPPVWTDSILIRNGLIAAVGSYLELKKDSVNIEIVDLAGNYIFPGFCDSHLHMIEGGLSLETLDLSNLNLEESAKLLRESENETSKKDWIIAYNWDPVTSPITAEYLEKWIPNRLVFIHQKDLHSCCCSLTALKLAGIDKNTPNPSDGKIQFNSKGNLTGVLFENAIGLVSSLLPKLDKSDKKRLFLKAQDYLLKLGITAVSEVFDLGSDTLFEELDAGGELVLDIDGWIRLENWDGMEPTNDNYRKLSIKTLKIFLDGSFGSRSAALIDPYSDDAFNTGTLFYKDSELKKIILNAQNSGWQIAMHAIGDSAADQALRVLSEVPVLKNIRHRIEHIQLCPDDFKTKLGKKNFSASIQPIHLLDDQKWLMDRIGKNRSKRGFLWKSLLEEGITLASGSDWPVAGPDPLLNIHTMINRCGFKGEVLPEFNSNEKLDPVAAIRSVSYGWAYASGKENIRGSISSGQKADLTIVSDISPDMKDWSDAKISMTICDGKIVLTE